MANITHWNPLRSLGRIESRTPLFDDFFREFGMRPRWKELDAPDMRIDVSEDERSYAVKAEIPGVDKQDIDVAIDGNQVSITAEIKRETSKKDEQRNLYTERYFGQVFRSFILPGEVDSAKSDARYENGVLTLTLPKKENGNARKLTVS